MSEEKVNLELIIHRLDTIAENQESFSKRLGHIEERLNVIGTHEFEIKSLKEWKSNIMAVASPSEIKDIMQWKDKIDEIVSPSQLKDKIIEIEKLKVFKTQALMIWIVIQALMAIALFADKFMH
jgi:formyltetrahydrofolate synthetase